MDKVDNLESPGCPFENFTEKVLRVCRLCWNFKEGLHWNAHEIPKEKYSLISKKLLEAVELQERSTFCNDLNFLIISVYDFNGRKDKRMLICSFADLKRSQITPVVNYFLFHQHSKNNSYSHTIKSLRRNSNSRGNKKD